MAMRIQRLFRASRALPLAPRRRPMSTQIDDISPPSASASEVDAASISSAPSTSTTPPPPPPPPPPEEDPDLTTVKPSVKKEAVHRALANVYEPGMVLRRGEGPLDRLDEKTGVPTWGTWGVTIKANPSHVITAPHFWLRDNCRCAKCVNGDTMQRAFDTFSIPQNIQPKEVQIRKEGLQVTWANDDHVSMYAWDWLLRHRKSASFAVKTDEKKNSGDKTRLWGSTVGQEPPSVRYEEVMADDQGVGKWTAKIREYGFCYVDGCPPTPEATKELLERIAFIRVTHYGGFYDFTADLTMKDTAYTNLALPAHTDTAYFTDPAGLQMFHLLSHTDGDGGASLLVDGFNAAKTLLKESYSAYNVLSRTPISWHASGNEGITITPAKKMPVLSFQDFKEGEVPRLLQVRWNNDDRGVVALKEDHGMGAEKWYKAAAKFNEILNRKGMQYWAQMKPGSPLIFDNWRVLHGRSAFTGKRRVCGGYINHDDYVSRWRNTNYTREEVLKQIL